MSDLCAIDDCGKPAYCRSMCRGHYTRERRGRPVAGPLRLWADPRRTLMEAAFAFADGSEMSEDTFLNAWKRLYAAARGISLREARAQGRDAGGRFLAP